MCSLAWFARHLTDPRQRLATRLDDDDDDSGGDKRTAPSTDPASDRTPPPFRSFCVVTGPRFARRDLLLNWEGDSWKAGGFNSNQRWVYVCCLCADERVCVLLRR